MKKVLCLIFAIFGCFIISSCGKKKDEGNQEEIEIVEPTGNNTVYGGSLSVAGSEVVITNNACYGLAESMYAVWKDTSVDNAKVFYKISEESTYIEVDKPLIRNNVSSGRVDILGLKSGLYDVKIEPGDNTQDVIFTNVKVYKNDRSGYAHFNATEAVGGYNNSGTVKENATIVYVNEATKNTVTATINGKNCTGLSAILQAQGNAGVPLIVRIIGTINAATWNQIKYAGKNLAASAIVDINGNKLPSQNLTQEQIITAGYNSMSTDINNGITVLNGLTNKIKYSSGEFDSYYNMLDVSGAKNVTVEGVGTDATLYQWGFTWKSCSNIEVRNLTFNDYTEDACSFEGVEDSTTIDGFSTGHIWIHNNTFNRGKNNWDVCPEQDKLDGDGATDFKKNAYITLSYNHYYNNHKTGLIGGSDTQKTACITFHHNFYQNCESRLPFARQANMHMYNNYYYASTGNNMQLYAGAYAFIEGCYFQSVNNPMVLKTSDGKVAAAKLFNNTFSSCKGTNGGTTVTSRTATVTNGCLYGNTFDTDSSIFYYDAVNQKSSVSYLTDSESAKEDCVNYAGVLTSSTIGVAWADSLNSVNQDSPIQGNETPAKIVIGELTSVYSQDFSSLSEVTETANQGISYVVDTNTTVLEAELVNGINDVSINNGTAIVNDTSSYTTLLVSSFDDQNSGVIVITCDVTPSKTASKWGFVQLYDSTDTEVIRIGSGTTKTNFGYRFSGEEIYTDSSEILAANIQYKFKIVIDFENDLISSYVTYDENEHAIFECINKDITSVNSIKFGTAFSDTTRSLIVDNILVSKSN